MTLLLTITFLLMTLLGAPIFIIIGGIALTGFVVSNDYDINSSISIIQEMYKIAEQPVFITIPLFTFAGYLMAESKTSERLINLSKAFFGWIPGGLGIVALVACSFFTVFTGASGVTIIALGGLLFPSLIKEKYPEKFSLGILTIGGSRGVTFPPSLPLILYGVIASMSMQNLESSKPVSIDNLFIAGAIPGIIELVVLAIYSTYIASKCKVERTSFSFKECISSLKKAFWELPIPLIILVGIYGGIFTASEAASVVAFYVFIVEVFIYRDISIKNDLVKIIKESMLLVGGIFIIIGVALGLTNFMIDQELPMLLLEWVKKYIDNKITFLIILNIFLLIVGALLDIFSAILVVVPLIIPIALEYGVDPIHLGIIFLLNLEIGYSTPPVGLNLFISSFRFNKSIITLYSSTLPFLTLMFITLILITYVPDISLALLEEDKTKGYLILLITLITFIASMLFFYKKTPKSLEEKNNE